MKTALMIIFCILTFYEKFKIINTTKTTVSPLCDTRLPIRALANISASSAEDVIVPNEIEVSWQFECDLHQQLLHQFTFEYCRLPECFTHAKTFSSILTLQNLYNLSSYSLEQLTPNSTYRIIFSSPEIATKYELYGRTDISVPDMPTDVRLVFKNDIELPVLVWDLPASSLQNIAYFYVTVSELLTGKYIYMSDKIDTSICFENICTLNQITSLKLKPALSYSLSVQCCNRKRHCSSPSQLLHSMPPRSPGKMNSPVLKPVNGSSQSYQILFKNPIPTNGPINEYFVKEVNENGDEQIYTVSNDLEVNNTIDSKIFTVTCSNETNKIRQTFYVSIAAANIELAYHINKTWVGEFSEPSQIDLCYNEANDAKQKKKQLMLTILWISIAVCAAAVILFLVLYFIYSGTKYFKNVKEKMRKLEIKVLSNERTAYIEQLKADDPQLYNRLQKLELKHVRHVSKLFASKLSTVVEADIEINEIFEKKVENEEEIISEQPPAAPIISSGYTFLPNKQTKQ